MRIKKVESLSISECCKFLKIRRKYLPEAIRRINEPTKSDLLVIARLESLLVEDKSAIDSCQTIEEYEGYLSTWTDGLHYDYARTRIDQLKAEAKELAFYQDNKGCISGLETYIKEYPNGKFIKEAQNTLESERKLRNLYNKILLTIIVVVIVIICMMTYSPVSYLDPFKEVCFGKKGGNISLLISTDANDNNVKIKCPADWVKMNRINDSLSISVSRNENDIQKALITVESHSSFLGVKYNYISRTISVIQESGLANFFEIEKDTLIIEDIVTYGDKIYPIKVNTDGTFWKVKKASEWLETNVNIEENILEISVSEKTGKIQIGTITLLSNNGISRNICVIQKGDPTDLRAAKSNIHFSIEGGNEYITISNDSFKELTCTFSDDDWVSASPDGNKMIQVSCSRNDDDLPRSSSILVCCGNEEIPIKVEQDGWKECRSCRGSGEKSCPNLYKQWWSLGMESYEYVLVNEKHVLRHNYMTRNFLGLLYWDYEEEICKICEGSGKIDCPDCKEGKIKVTY